MKANSDDLLYHMGAYSGLHQGVSYLLLERQVRVLTDPLTAHFRVSGVNQPRPSWCHLADPQFLLCPVLGVAG